MKSIKIAGLCLVAVFSMSMAVSGSALALPEKPFFVQCQKVLEAKTGNADDSQCSTAARNEKEWIKVVGGETVCRETLTKEAGNYEDSACTKKVAKKSFIKIAEPIETFSSVSGPGILEPASALAGKITCESDTDEGRITGPKEVGHVFVHFHKCKSSSTGKECETTGAGAGQINTNEVKGALGYVKKGAPVEVGLRLEPTVTGGLFAKFSCSGITVEVRGAIIGQAEPLNKMSKSGKVIYKQTGSSQAIKKFEGGAEEILESNFGLGFEKSGLETEDTIEFQDDTEIVA